MNKKLVFLAIFFSGFNFLQNVKATLVIDDPNPVVFGGNLIELGADVIVTVSVNNVIIDFDEYIIAGGDTGIWIPEGVSGVTLRNGTVAMLTGTGIVIEQNCSNITIENMKFSQCASSVIEMLGTSTTDIVSGVSVEDCVMQSCCTSPLATSAIHGSYAQNVFLNNVRILNSGNSTSAFSSIKFDNSERSIFLDTGIIGCEGFDFIGFDFINCETILFRGCRVANTMADATSGILTGFNFTGTSCNNLLTESLVLTNSAGSDVTGFNIEGNAESVTIGISRVIGNYSTAGNIYGFRFNGSGSPSSNRSSALSETLVVRNVTDGSGKMAVGILVDGADQCIVTDCKFAFQEATAGTGYGMLFAAGGGGDNWSVQQSEFIKNIGDSDANSYGISIESGTDNLFIKNFAFDNGDTPANQMSGVPLGSISELNPGNLNNAQTPWANVVVT